MTNLTVSLQNALSGLRVLGRVSETISSNVANASTDGYAPRSVAIRQNVFSGQGAGATVSSLTRSTDPALISDRRVAVAAYDAEKLRATFYSTIEGRIGLPNTDGALSGRMSDFGSGLVLAASRPDSEARLETALNAAKGVAAKLASTSEAVQTERMRADTAIAKLVEDANTQLQRIETLNMQFLRSGNRGGSEQLTIEDERQRAIDALSKIIPVREVRRESGAVSLFSEGGAILMESRAATIEFTQAGVITPDMAIGGALSGLTINGRSVSTAFEKGPIAGGKLAAQFDIRDTQAVSVQAQLDAAARDLVERFQDPAVDPTLGATDPGLFTDNGAAFAVANEVGLAGRITINALVDPAQGGAVWRLRDGLGAAAPGPTGNASILNALSDAFTAARTPSTGGFSSTSAQGVAGELVSSIGADQTNFTRRSTFEKARSDALISAELEKGVDTDIEMQRLLQLERAFGANAKVLSTVDELFETLLRI